MNLTLSKCFHLLQWLKCSCKYLTYEEWKLVDHSGYPVSGLSKYLTYEEWKRVVVVGSGSRPGFVGVSTLPMRNGNISALREGVSFYDRKYLTYEEWKRLSEAIASLLLLKCKYLTYKEWKPSVNLDCANALA